MKTERSRGVIHSTQEHVEVAPNKKKAQKLAANVNQIVDIGIKSSKKNKVSFTTKMKDIEDLSNRSKSEKVKLVNNLFHDELPKMSSLNDFFEIACELVRMAQIGIGHQNEIVKFFGSNPLLPAMDRLMEQYIRQIKREIEADLSKNNIAQFSDEGISLFNRRLIDALHLNAKTFEMMFKVNNRTFSEIYAENRIKTPDEEIAESLDKTSKVEEYEQELRKAWMQSGIGTDSFKR